MSAEFERFCRSIRPAYKNGTVQFRLTAPFFCFSAFYHASFFGASSLKSSAAKITAKPTPICGVTFSPSSRQENSTPNTDSSDSRMTACEAGRHALADVLQAHARWRWRRRRYTAARRRSRRVKTSIGMPRSRARLYTACTQRAERELQHDQRIGVRLPLAAARRR